LLDLFVRALSPRTECDLEHRAFKATRLRSYWDSRSLKLPCKNFFF
jgi:hypothetical protein